MSTTRIVTDDIKSQWNAVANHPLQAWEWGEVRKATGVEVVRIGVYEGETLTQTFQMTIHTIPYTSWKIGYVPRSVFPTDDVLAFVKDHCATFHMLFVTFEPYVLTHEVKTVSSQLVSSAHPLFPLWSQIIDTHISQDELWTKLKPKTRYNIGLAQRKGVTIKEMTSDEGFEIFSTLYFDTCKRQKYRGHTKHYHKQIFDHLRGSIAHILVAFYEGKPLSAYELFHFKDRLYYPYGGSSTENREVMASNLLMWEAIRFAKHLDVTSFDLWGSLAPDYDPVNPWAGFTRFKEGYNAQFVEFVGSYDLVLQPALYNIYGIINSIRKRLL